ncbi:hypothetical protein PA598K_00840 [Paenibacillus sp. 598K]|nr:hypothetical protein PA598K_00840 [Paenibacillus sp. 598K]
MYYVDQSVHHYHGTAAPPAPAKRAAKSQQRAGVVALLLICAFIVYIGWTASQNSDALSGGVQHTIRTEPQSEVLQVFVRDILNKGGAMPTQEDLASLRYLAAGKEDDQWRFTYSFDDPFTNEQAELREYVVVDKRLNGQKIEQQDFEAFPGLAVLDLRGEYDIARSDHLTYSHMKDLKRYSGSFNESFSSFIHYFADPAKLRSLSLQIRSNAELALLQQFTNLQSLDLTYVDESVTDFHLLQELPLRSLSVYSVDDLRWLSSLSGLESLAITYSDTTDVSSLYALSQLRELKLAYTPNVKTLDFVASMPNLQRLDVENTELASLEPLRGKLSLTKLRLVRAGAAESMEAVGSLGSLTELTISGYYGTPLSLSLPQVRRAELPASFIPELEAPALQTLTVSLSSAELSGSSLRRFPQLTRLSLMDGSMTDVAALDQLPELRVIDAVDASFYDETRALFELQHVTEFSCDDCQFDIQGDEPFRNETLQQLTLARSYYRVKDQNVDVLDRVTPYLTGLTGLRSFTLQDSTIQKLDFMKGWQQLEELHLEHNAIADLGPLTALPKLKKLYLAGNPAQNKTVLGDTVTIY